MYLSVERKWFACDTQLTAFVVQHKVVDSIWFVVKKKRNLVFIYSASVSDN